MWNKAGWNARKEIDQDAISEKPAAASSSEALGSHLGAKRQRRPSVRLEEIGGRPAAFLAEKRTRKIGSCVAFGNSRSKVGDSVATLEVEELQESDAANSFKAGKLIKTRPLVHINNGNVHDHFSSDDGGGDSEMHAARSADLASPCSATPVEKWPEPHPALHSDVAEKAPLQFFKSISKKGRNSNRKRGGSKAAACVKQLSSTAQLAMSPNAEGVSCTKDAQGMHFDEENEARTPEGFRDCDLETSDYLNDDKEMSNSQGSKASRGGNMSPLKDQQESQPLQVSEDGFLKPEKGFVERSRGACPSQQAFEENLRRQVQAFEPRYDVETQILTESSRLPHENKVKSPAEADENQEKRELSDNPHLHDARHNPPLLNGVRGWLENLGLGKYAQHFEAHEVDSEVLPLLTFDDLKEMGISAVGSRRKMFYAIQQLGKCLLVKADQAAVVGL